MDIKLLSRMQNACSRREYCSSDIYDKVLRALGGDSSSASEILESLRTDGYVDDLRYATAFARDKSAIAGWGPVKIRYALSAKKISRECIDAALSEIDVLKADVRLQHLMENKWRSLQGDPQARLKLLKFGLSRGYEYSQVEKAAASICG